MDLGAYLSVALSLAAFYWMLSTVCSMLLEIGAVLLNTRGSGLTKFISEMLENGGDGSFAQKVLDHPLIKSLKKPMFRLRGKDTPPSYVPATNFSAAVFDLAVRELHSVIGGISYLIQRNVRAPQLAAVLTGAAQAIPAEENGNQDTIRQGLQEALRQVIRQIGPDTSGLQDLLGPDLAARVQGQLDPASIAQKVLDMTLYKVSPVTMSDMEEALRSGVLGESLTRALTPLVANMAHDIDEARRAVEQWYDSVMERATGWYKRHSGLMLTLLALLISVAWCIDSLAIAKHLVRNAEARSRLEGVALAIANDPSGMRDLLRREVVGQMYIEREVRVALGGDERWSEIAKNLRDKIRAQAQLLLRALPPPNLLLYIYRALEGNSKNEDESKKAWEEVIRECLTTCKARGVEETDCAKKLADALNLSTWDAQKVEEAFWNDETILGKGTIDRAAVVRRFLAAAATVETLDEQTNDQTKKEAKDRFDKEVNDRFEEFRKVLREDDATVANVWSALFASRFDIRSPSISWIWRWEKGDDGYSFLLRVIGIVLTTIMAGLGATFWFELINKLVNVRGTGEKPNPVPTAQ